MFYFTDIFINRFFSLFTMQIIPLEDVLQPGQEYLLEYAKKFGKEIKAVKHNRATDTCHEKFGLLKEENFNEFKDVKQVVKTVFLYGANKENKGKFYAFVASELGDERNPLKFDNPLIKRIFYQDRKKAKNLMDLDNKNFPLGTERGTCGPIVPDYYFDGDGLTGTLEEIYFYDLPELDKEYIDISMGGYGKFFHIISVHMKYEDLFECLNWKYPGKIRKVLSLKNI